MVYPTHVKCPLSENFSKRIRPEQINSLWPLPEQGFTEDGEEKRENDNQGNGFSKNLKSKKSLKVYK